jgi:hypothetical protein
MNSHEFRTVVKDLDSATIKKYNIKPAYFKAVCFALSMYGDYKSGTRVRPSWLTVAKDACVDRKTAMKVRDLLISSGILIPVSKTEANISVYEFSDDYSFTGNHQLSKSSDQLSNSNNQLSNSDGQLSSIDGHNTTIDTTFNSIKDITITKINTSKPERKGSSGWKHINLLEL